ncbi:MAG: GNAT family N-acetyltransferase [Anaerolineae bacterium]|nr:GNAT family N-acetyltransferase [Anaerolineae bacterium]MCI0609680.1 GNAT family N-acetyltransferase [Anaerolineae bacterium]
MLTQTKKIIHDLGDGLILRHASPEDADALSQFNGEIHAEDEADKERLAAWTRDLLTRPHPTLNPSDFTIIEEAATGRIVSSLNLIPQMWSYEGIEFGVGRPELVGTLPEYRGRGLVRIQFDEIHQWCAERGYMVQAITGIPYFYRQFGYEMALDLAGRRYGYEEHVPKLNQGEEEKYTFRLATDVDLAFIAEIYNHAIQGQAIACVLTPAIFKYELDGQNQIYRNLMFVIEDKSGERLGYFQHRDHLGATGLTVNWYELKNDVSWLDVTPSVVRYAWNKGKEYEKRDGKACTSFCFMLGAEHPAYEALGNNLPYYSEPYAWYLRVSDLPGFLNHIKPVLEKRLAESIAPGHSREIKIGFYRGGLRFVIEHGHIRTIEAWKSALNDEGDIAFPGLTFLQILFGYRSYEELHYAFPDCWCDHRDVRVLINILFPKKISNVFGIA